MDVNEYNACVHDWADPLYRFALKCTGSRDDANDVVQHCFEILWQKRAEVMTGKAKSFLFTIGYRRAVDYYRNRGRIIITDLPEPDVDHRATSPDLKKILERALRQLGERERALVLLHDHEGYKYEEIARITGLTEMQVKVYLHRARKTLKNYLVSIENII